MESFPFLKKVASWPTLFGAALGAAIVCFLVYPPSAGGWTAKDRLVDWLSAIGTMGSAIGAVVIASWQSSVGRRERKDRGERLAALLTIDVARHLISLRAEINYARELASDADIVVNMISEGAAARLLFLPSAKHLPDPKSLFEMPADVADSVAVLAMTAGAYNDIIERAAEVASEVPPRDAATAFISVGMLDEVQLALANAVQYLKPYQGVLEKLDFLDRGDGTRLVR